MALSGRWRASEKARLSSLRCRMAHSSGLVGPADADGWSCWMTAVARRLASGSARLRRDRDSVESSELLKVGANGGEGVGVCDVSFEDIEDRPEQAHGLLHGERRLHLLQAPLL